jgi:predicted metal-dependent RNase
MELKFFGGSGEYGRACFAVLSEHKNILLDCGVKRIQIKNKVGEYPLIDGDLIKNIDYVFLSHAHEDHCAALPLLYKLGYDGYIFCTEETAIQSRDCIKKWIDTVLQNNGALPFNLSDVDKVKYRTITLGKSIIEKNFEVEAGMSGHMVGGVWFKFRLDSKKIFYSGDYCFDSILLNYEMPYDKCDIAIIDASYGDDNTRQEKYWDGIYNKIKETVTRGGKALLPVPARGRGAEILLLLTQRPLLIGENRIEIYVEKNILDAVNEVKCSQNWLKTSAREYFENFNSALINVISSKSEREKIVRSESPAVILCTDGMISSETSLYYFESISKNELNTIILTGYQAEGTIGKRILSDEGRKELNVKCEVVNIRYKVHPGFNDLLILLDSIKPDNTFLVHCEFEICKNLVPLLKKDGYNSNCFMPGEFIKV